MKTKEERLQTLRQKVKQLEEKIIKLNLIPKRQHGKEGTKADTEEGELKRLYNNYHSVISRYERKELEKKQVRFYNECNNISSDEDEYGIRPVDERRYKNCFKSGYIGAPVERSYVITMTGLTLKQIAILQERTGYIPTPPVSMKEADVDAKRRWETGDIY